MVSRYFDMVDMSITRCCNMKCRFCTATQTHSYDKIMLFGDFKQLFDKIQLLMKDKKIEIPRKFISYGNAGEPLMNPHFIKINKYVKECGWHSGIYTNGVLLTKEKMMQIYENGGIDTINVSITGINTKIYQHFQGYGFEVKEQKKLLELVKKNIEDAVKIKNDLHQRTKIAVNYIITKGTIIHIIPYVQYMKKIGVDEIRFTPLVDRPRANKTIKVKCNRISYNIRQNFSILNVDQMGDISPCNNDLIKSNVIGNLWKDDWLDKYDYLVCAQNSNDDRNFPKACRVCDRTNFYSVWDYLSINFHGYLEFKDNRIMWKESLNQYMKAMLEKIRWYYAERYKV